MKIASGLLVTPVGTSWELRGFSQEGDTDLEECPAASPSFLSHPPSWSLLPSTGTFLRWAVLDSPSPSTQALFRVRVFAFDFPAPLGQPATNPHGHFIFCNSFMRSNSHTVQCTNLRGPVQWFLVYSQLCNHHRNQLSEHFHHPKEKPHTLLAVTLHYPCSPLPSATTHRPSVPADLPVWTFHINEITLCGFCDWLLSLSRMPSRIINAGECTSLLFAAK